MTRILITTVLFLFSLYTNAQQEKSVNKIKILIKDISAKKGKMYFSLYQKDGFSSRKAIARKQILIDDTKIEITFDSIPNGNYAILCFLDENDNKRMDFNIQTGIPTELYGVSNNPTLFGPPTFESAKFDVKDKDVEINISL